MRNKRWPWALTALVVLALVACSCVSLGVLAFGGLNGLTGLVGGLGDAVAIVQVRGAIMSGKPPYGIAGSGIVYSERVIQDLAAANADPRVAAIVLDIDSPGGTVVASADIYRALKECPKPIVTSMGEMAASGGYYIACGTQYIVARPATLTGSIGVRWEFVNAQELMRKLGVEVQSIKSGEHKDQGGWHRPLSEEEMAALQLIVEESWIDFVQIVAQNRSLPEEEVRALADGRVFTGRQALDLGLVDAEGGQSEAIQIAAEMGGIEGEPRIVRFERPPGLLEALLGVWSRARRPTELILLEELLGRGRVPSLQYLYTGP